MCHFYVEATFSVISFYQYSQNSSLWRTVQYGCSPWTEDVDQFYWGMHNVK